MKNNVLGGSPDEQTADQAAHIEAGDASASEPYQPGPIYVGEAASPASPAAQAQVDRLVDYVNQRIELLTLEDPEPFLLRQMVQCLVDPRRATRLNLIDALSQIGECATPFLLEGITNHQDSVVRRACCNALTNIGDPTSVSGLIEALLHDSDIGVKSAAAGALAKVGASAFDSLRDVLADEAASESSKGHAAWAMASMSTEVSDQLYRIISHPSPAVRTAVIGAIAQFAQSQTAQAQTIQAQTVQAQSDQPKGGRFSAGEASPTPAEKAHEAMIILTEALSDESSEVRIEAAANLARLHYQDAYQPLIACLKDRSAEVRKAAALALGKLGNADAIDSVTALQRDVDRSVQKVAVIVIDQLNTRQPALKQIQNESTQ